MKSGPPISPKRSSTGAWTGGFNLAAGISRPTDSGIQGFVGDYVCFIQIADHQIGIRTPPNDRPARIDADNPRRFIRIDAHQRVQRKLSFVDCCDKKPQKS